MYVKAALKLELESNIVDHYLVIIWSLSGHYLVIIWSLSGHYLPQFMWQVDQKWNQIKWESVQTILIVTHLTSWKSYMISIAPIYMNNYQKILIFRANSSITYQTVNKDTICMGFRNITTKIWKTGRWEIKVITLIIESCVYHPHQTPDEGQDNYPILEHL